MKEFFASQRIVGHCQLQEVNGHVADDTMENESV